MKTILIVEDEKTLRDALARKLQDSGYSVLEATDGQEGLDTALSEKPDLILLDLIMPKLSGNEVLYRLRADEWGANVKVIVLTNLSDTDEVKHAVANSADFFVKSDWKLGDIVEQVKDKLDE